MPGSPPLNQARPLWAALDEPRRVEAIRALCIAGMTTIEAAAALGTDPETVTVIRLRHDIEPAYRRRDDIRLAPEKRETIARMTVAGCSDDEIAAVLGVTRRMIARHRAAYRLPSPRRDLDLHPAAVLRLLALHREGARQADAAAALGIHPATLGRLFRRLGRRWGRHNTGRPDTPLRAEVVRLVGLGVYPSDIARRTGRSRAAVSNLLRRLLAEGAIDRVPRARRSRDAVAAAMRAIHARGGNLDECAANLGCGRAAAAKWARKLGLSFPPARRHA